MVSGGRIPARPQNQLGAVLQTGAKQLCVTADSFPLFPCLPKTAWAPLNSLLGAEPVPSPCQALLGQVLLGSSQHRALCGALACFNPWGRHSQEGLSCAAIPASRGAELGGLQGSHALSFTGRVVTLLVVEIWEG